MTWCVWAWTIATALACSQLPPPPFNQQAKFLSKDTSNVAVVHCKAGKGRTGLMVSCFLLHSEVARTAEEATRIFGEVRTEDGHGVTIPSQHRYVGYYEAILAGKSIEEIPALTLNRITLTSIPKVRGGGGVGRI